MSRNKKFIVITGQIGSGKSTLSELIKEKRDDYLILDADDQVKQLYKRGAILYKVLVNEFGDSILNEKNNISKSKLREVVFLNDENRKKLNALTHPVILKNMVNIAKNSDSDVVFFQIPLLNESIDILKKLVNIDEVWNIAADYDVRFNRILKRKGITEPIANRIMSVQSEFESEDFDLLTVENNGDIDDLRRKVDLFFENSSVVKEKKSGFFNRKRKKDNKDEKILENEKVEEKNLEDSELEDKILSTGKFSNDSDNIKKDLENDKKNLDESIKRSGIDLKTLEKQDSLGMEKTKLTNLGVLREKSIENSNNFDKNLVFDDEISCVESELNKEKKVKKKKKMKILKRVLISILVIVVLFFGLFFGAVYYGGVNYPVDYIEEIQKYSKEYGVDPNTVLAIIRVESNFKKDAVSKVNAKGLMQILPDTAKHVAKLMKEDVNSLDLNDPETNIKIGTYYIKYLSQNFSNMDTVYAAYNGGIGNVNNWLKDAKYSNDGVTLYNTPSSETNHYVYKVNKALKAYKILYGEDFPTKKTKGFSKFIENIKNTIKYIFRNF